LGLCTHQEYTVGGYVSIVDQARREPIRPETTLGTRAGGHMCEMADDTIAAVGHRTPFPSLVLINGQVHGHGRLSERKFRREVEGPARTRASIVEKPEGT